jgi:hypothetical protein
VVCTLYRFTDEPMWEFPKLGIGPMSPTNEWARFTTLADARAALRSADISEPALHPKAQGLGREEKTGQRLLVDGELALPTQTGSARRRFATPKAVARQSAERAEGVTSGPERAADHRASIVEATTPRAPAADRDRRLSRGPLRARQCEPR